MALYVKEANYCEEIHESKNRTSVDSLWVKVKGDKIDMRKGVGYCRSLS